MRTCETCLRPSVTRRHQKHCREPPTNSGFNYHVEENASTEGDTPHSDGLPTKCFKKSRVSSSMEK